MDSTYCQHFQILTRLICAAAFKSTTYILQK
jgi:hypothetical protein